MDAFKHIIDMFYTPTWLAEFDHLTLAYNHCP
jgi:hypothetical protein